MTQLRDLRLDTTGRLEQIEPILKKRRTRLRKEFGRLATPQEAIGFRVTGIPINKPSNFQRVFRNDRIVPEFAMPRVAVKSDYRFGRDFNYLVEVLSESYSFLYRGARSRPRQTLELKGNSRYAEVYEDGLVELGFVAEASAFTKVGAYFDPDWSLGMFAHVLAWIFKLRQITNFRGLEYTIDVEICVRNAAIDMGWNPDLWWSINGISKRETGVIARLKDVEFPLYRFGECESRDELLELFQTHMFSRQGSEVPEYKRKLSISFDYC